MKTQIILNISMEDNKKKLDKALKRNQVNQTKVSAAATENKQSSSEMPIEEPISDTEIPEEE